MKRRLSTSRSPTSRMDKKKLKRVLTTRHVTNIRKRSEPTHKQPKNTAPTTKSSLPKTKRSKTT